MIVRNITGYQTSRDYALLWELGQKQSVVCIVDYYEDCRDVRQTIWNGRYMQVSSRGNGYVDGDTAEEFAKWCQRSNVEFLIPNDAFRRWIAGEDRPAPEHQIRLVEFSKR